MSARTVFHITLGLLLLQTLYGLYWAGHDLSARLGLWPDPVQAAEFVATLGLVQETLFFSHVILNVVALILARRHSRFALPVFVLSFLADRTDWVLMSDNTLFNTLFDWTPLTLISFTVQASIIALLTLLMFNGQLGPKRAV